MIIEGIIKIALAAGVYKISTVGDMRFSTHRQARNIGIIIAVVLLLWGIYDLMKAAGVL